MIWCGFNSVGIPWHHLWSNNLPWGSGRSETWSGKPVLLNTRHLGNGWISGLGAEMPARLRCLKRNSEEYWYIYYIYVDIIVIGVTIIVIRRNVRSQTSDNMDRWKAEMGRVREKRRVEERRSEKRKSQKKEDAGARKGRKVAKHCVCRMICGSGGSKSRLAKAAGAEPSS